MLVDYAAFLRHSMHGGGWGSVVNLNEITALLCNIGLIGTTSFRACGVLTLGYLTMGARIAQASDWKLVTYGAGVRNALLVGSACAITSGIKYVFLSKWVSCALGIAIVFQLEVGQRAKAKARVVSCIPRSRLTERAQATAL